MCQRSSGGWRGRFSMMYGMRPRATGVRILPVLAWSLHRWPTTDREPAASFFIAFWERVTRCERVGLDSCFCEKKPGRQSSARTAHAHARHHTDRLGCKEHSPSWNRDGRKVRGAGSSALLGGCCRGQGPVRNVLWTHGCCRQRDHGGGPRCDGGLPICLQNLHPPHWSRLRLLLARSTAWLPSLLRGPISRLCASMPISRWIRSQVCRGSGH